MKYIKMIGNELEHVYNKTFKYIKLTLITLAVSFGVVIGCWKIWEHNINKFKDVSRAPPSAELNEIYEKIKRATDVSNRVPPLGIWASMESLFTVNAFTTGTGIYFTYVADAVLSTDEKALVMGHEIAHVILHHTDNEYQMFVDNHSNEDELMADNVGAVWADKAGYDVCKGREVFMKFYLWGGNSLNAVHPPNTYRYENLAHYCKQERNNGNRI